MISLCFASSGTIFAGRGQGLERIQIFVFEFGAGRESSIGDG